MAQLKCSAQRNNTSTYPNNSPRIGDTLLGGSATARRWGLAQNGGTGVGFAVGSEAKGFRWSWDEWFRLVEMNWRITPQDTHCQITLRLKIHLFSAPFPCALTPMHTRTYVLACARTGGRTRIHVGGVFRTNSATNGKLEDEGVSL